MFIAGTSPMPVWRDGLTTNLTYVFLAVKQSAPVYNAVVYGNGKIKFYPNAEYFGLTRAQVEGCGANGYLNRSGQFDAGYERWTLPRNRIEDVLKLLRGQRGTVVAPHPPAVEEAISNGTNRQGGEHPRGSGPMTVDNLRKTASTRAQSTAQEQMAA